MPCASPFPLPASSSPSLPFLAAATATVALARSPRIFDGSACWVSGPKGPEALSALVTFDFSALVADRIGPDRTG